MFEVFTVVFDIHFMEHYWTFKCTAYQISYLDKLSTVLAAVLNGLLRSFGNLHMASFKDRSRSTNRAKVLKPDVTLQVRCLGCRADLLAVDQELAGQCINGGLDVGLSVVKGESKVPALRRCLSSHG